MPSSAAVPLTVTTVVDDGRVREVRFTNVASYVEVTGVELTVDGVDLRLDIAVGGAFYAVLGAAAVGATVTPPPTCRVSSRGAARSKRPSRRCERPRTRRRDIYVTSTE